MWLPGLLALGALGGCGSGVQECTAIGSPPGIGVSGPGASEMVLEWCRDGTCREHAVTRWSADPQHGFADIPELPAEPVRVTLTADGQRLDPVTVVPEPTYPNGEDCPAGGPAASVTVDRHGNVRPG